MYGVELRRPDLKVICDVAQTPNSDVERFSNNNFDKARYWRLVRTYGRSALSKPLLSKFRFGRAMNEDQEQCRRLVFWKTRWEFIGCSVRGIERQAIGVTGWWILGIVFYSGSFEPSIFWDCWNPLRDRVAWTKFLPLYARIKLRSGAAAIFKSHSDVSIVLSTNVAETRNRSGLFVLCDWSRFSAYEPLQWCDRKVQTTASHTIKMRTHTSQRANNRCSGVLVPFGGANTVLYSPFMTNARIFI